jgi:hypothetical protein
MNYDEILEQLTEDILTYAMQGGFPEEEIARQIKPEGLDERFKEYELLLDLHFILQEDVIEFVRALPKQLRSIRTETESISRTRRGTVDGHINWNATIKTRYSQNPGDTSLFVCENRSEDYDIAENLVLKQLLSVIYTTLKQADDYLREDYQWVQDTWQGNEDLVSELQRIVERNVHVRRIRAPETYEPTERMLTTAEQARQSIYRDAAALVRNRQRLFDGEPDAIRALLNETAITPDDEHTLFELFVLFRFVSTIEDLVEERFQFKTIASGRQEIAHIEGDKEIVLYHDNSASDRELSFRANVPDAGERQLSRTEKVQTVARNVASNYFQTEFQNHTARPDVITLEIIDEEANEFEYLIAEVKNSTNMQTVRQGIKEAVEYLAFLRVNEDFVFGTGENADYFGTGWNGLLVVQDMERETASLAEQDSSEVKILQASELDDHLPTVLEELL